MAVPFTCDEVFQLAERLKVDPVTAVVQQFCRNGGDSNELTQAVADVKQISKDMYACLIVFIVFCLFTAFLYSTCCRTPSQATCPQCAGKDHSSVVEVFYMIYQFIYWISYQ